MTAPPKYDEPGGLDTFVDDLRLHWRAEEVVAPDEEDAKAVLAIARVVIPKVDFPGRLCKEGNMAFPFSPSDIEVGPVYRFSVYHVAELDDPTEPFLIQYETI